MQRKGKFWIASIAIALALSSCTNAPDGPSDPDNIGNCTPVFAAVSSEKVNLVTELNTKFKESPEGKALEEALGNCVAIVPKDVASGAATDLLKAGWPTENTLAPRPAIWSPASSSWVASVAESKGKELVPNPVSFARTPVVMAMPVQMARTLGWPDKPIGLHDLHDLCLDSKGWGKFGGGATTWGNFKLGKTTPTTSTTGLNIVLMQNYAAANKTSGLTEADITAGNQFSKELESCVIHYGDTTGSVLERLYQKNSLSYVSAIAVEETSVINYNLGNPKSQVVKAGDELTKPDEQNRLVAIYPTEGSLESDNPIVALGKSATWVTDEQRTAAEAFIKFVQTPIAQNILGNFGFRPADPAAKPSGLISAENGVDPTKPTVRLETPSVAVASAATKQWIDVRKPARVEIVLDISDSMNDSIGGNDTRISMAKKSASSVIGHFRGSDQVGVSAFTTDGKNSIYSQLRPLSPLGSSGETLKDDILAIQTGVGTPLFDAIGLAFERVKEGAESGQINAIIVISDGMDNASRMDADDLKRLLRGSTEGNDPAQVRVFPIIYGEEAPADVLREIAEASGGQVFNAKDPRRLDQVMRSVVNNF
ncbi:MAG TPA: substrate-binding domain-containing protein [Candidatus Saccharimonadales bacterium]